MSLRRWPSRASWSSTATRTSGTPRQHRAPWMPKPCDGSVATGASPCLGSYVRPAPTTERPSAPSKLPRSLCWAVTRARIVPRGLQDSAMHASASGLFGTRGGRSIRSSARPPASLADQHRHRAVCKHPSCLAAQQDLCNAAPPMRRHDDQVTALRLSVLDDAFRRMVVRHMHRVARDAKFAREIANGAGSPGGESSSSRHRSRL